MNTFSLLLVFATILSGIAYFYDYKKDRPQRLKARAALLESNAKVSKKELKKIMEPQSPVGQFGSLFFIILFVFVFRSFIFEPFRIPSGSMMPTLLSGDFIAVSKWSYGIKNPLTGNTLIRFSDVERGDVIVFKYPEDPSVDYIKRVIGLPGDEITYHNKQLYIRRACTEGQCESPKRIDLSQKGVYTQKHATFEEKYLLLDENLDGVEHEILINPLAPDMRAHFYRQEGKDVATWVVPEDHYFVMGDNRDNSQDSRFWGFVPRDYIAGKTVCIWLSVEYENESDFLPSAIRFERIGSVK